ncbi:MAG TPA: amidohydrolase family protein, partial [Acidimicrobiales bacterium]|nr:amidohydrolase family protein [Acidimicrobiales bacterium]
MSVPSQGRALSPLLQRGADALRGGFVLEGGTVFDGTGAPGRVVDVFVRGGRVVAVGTGAGEPAGTPRLDCRGLYVAPGFIDIHSHSDFTLLRDPRASSSVFQGVTLELVGNCGYGCFPIGDGGAAGESIYGFDTSPPIDWRSAAEYFAALEARAPAVNVASLTPNAQLRRSALASVGERATPVQVRALVRALEVSLDDGSFGLSTGLEYASEAMVTEEETVELLRPVVEIGALYATHTRDRNGDGTAGVAEALRVAGRAGARLQISHLLPRGGDGAGRACLELVEEATARGARVAFDQHTRLFGFTVLASMLPAWAF